MPRESPLRGVFFCAFHTLFSATWKEKKIIGKKFVLFILLPIFAIPYAKQGATRKFSEGHSVTQKIRPRILLGGKRLIFNQKSLSLRQRMRMLQRVTSSFCFSCASNYLIVCPFSVPFLLNMTTPGRQTTDYQQANIHLIDILR